MLTEERRKYVLNEHLGTIYVISDEEYHRRVWINGEPIGVDFDEICCIFFEVCDPILEDYKDFFLTEAQYQILKNFRDRFDEFSSKSSWEPDFIGTPEWEEIKKMAREVLKAFDYRP